MKILHVFLLLVLSYVAVGAYSELHLISLVRSPESRQPEPTVYRDSDTEHSFHDRKDMEIYQAEDFRNRRFPWSRDLEEWQALGILAAACGYAGGLVRLFMESQTGEALHKNSPFIGMALGIILTLTIDRGCAVMMEGDLHFRPGLVVGLCLVSGIAWESAWTFLQKKAAIDPL